jgi:methylated-DNA-[protein]-cysteine S-methyltransferase
MSSPPFDAVLALPSCRLGVRSTAQALSELVFLPPDTPIYAGQQPLAQALAELIARWLNNPQQRFDLPLQTRGTPFQRRIWQAISAIPLGETRHYGELSALHGGTARAVGQACGANPFPIIVPCHRVLAKSGLGGFAHARDGWLLETKRWLLQHEMQA